MYSPCVLRAENVEHCIDNTHLATIVSDSKDIYRVTQEGPRGHPSESLGVPRRDEFQSAACSLGGR